MKILVADGLTPEGVERLKPHAEVVVANGLGPERLRETITDIDALIVRSRTRVDREAIERAARLRVIARAGVGIDNIDVDAATRRGILVLNTPESSTVSTAEHTLAVMLALARHLPAAHLAASQGQWQREPFLGIELYGKTLGVAGLGKIGSEVARRASAFGMRVLASDPYVTAERAARLGVELVPWEQLLEQSDILTLHLPLTPQTMHLVGPAAFARMRPGVMIINCARGGLIDEQALLAALQEGKVAGAALDVLEEEPPSRDSPLLHDPRVLITPHLGASTAEAQRTIAVDVADQVLAALDGRPVKGAVNSPALHDAVWQRIRPYADLMRYLGAIARHLIDGQLTAIDFIYEGEVAVEETEPLSASFLVGLLETTSEQPVNLVNAAVLTRERGIRLRDLRETHSEDFSSLIRARLETTQRALVLGGTLFGRHEPRMTHLNEYRIDLVPAPHMLFVWNEDRPGMIGRVGTLLGSHQVNIANMQVGRVTPGGLAVMVLTVDTPVPEGVVGEIARLDGITGVRSVSI